MSESHHGHAHAHARRDQPVQEHEHVFEAALAQQAEEEALSRSSAIRGRADGGGGEGREGGEGVVVDICAPIVIARNDDINSDDLIGSQSYPYPSRYPFQQSPQLSPQLSPMQSGHRYQHLHDDDSEPQQHNQQQRDHPSHFNRSASHSSNSFGGVNASIHRTISASGSPTLLRRPRESFAAAAFKGSQKRASNVSIDSARTLVMPSGYWRAMRNVVYRTGSSSSSNSSSSNSNNNILGGNDGDGGEASIRPRRVLSQSELSSFPEMPSSPLARAVDEIEGRNADDTPQDWDAGAYIGNEDKSVADYHRNSNAIQGQQEIGSYDHFHNESSSSSASSMSQIISSPPNLPSSIHPYQESKEDNGCKTRRQTNPTILPVVSRALRNDSKNTGVDVDNDEKILYEKKNYAALVSDASTLIPNQTLTDHASTLSLGGTTLRANKIIDQSSAWKRRSSVTTLVMNNDHDNHNQNGIDGNPNSDNDQQVIFADDARHPSLSVTTSSDHPSVSSNSTSTISSDSVSTRTDRNNRDIFTKKINVDSVLKIDMHMQDSNSISIKNTADDSDDNIRHGSRPSNQNDVRDDEEDDDDDDDGDSDSQQPGKEDDDSNRKTLDNRAGSSIKGEVTSRNQSNSDSMTGGMASKSESTATLPRERSCTMSTTLSTNSNSVNIFGETSPLLGGHADKSYLDNEKNKKSAKKVIGSRRESARQNQSGSSSNKDRSRTGKWHLRWQKVVQLLWKAAHWILNLPPQAKNTIKSVVAFGIAIAYAALFPVPQSSYLSIITVGFFHPSRTVGAMTFAAVCAVVAIVVSTTMAIFVNFLVTVCQDNGNPYAGRAILMISLFINALIFSYFRGRFNVPAVTAATTLGMLMVVPTHTRLVYQEAKEVPFESILSILYALSGGCLISIVVNIFLWPTFATAALRKDVAASLKTLSTTLKLVTKSFLLDPDIQPVPTASQSLPNSNDAPTGSLYTANKIKCGLAELRSAALRLAAALKDSGWEIAGCGYARMNDFDAVLRSLGRVSQHLGAMHASCRQYYETSLRESEHLKKFTGTLRIPLKSLGRECRLLLVRLRKMFTSKFYLTRFFSYDDAVWTLDAALQSLDRSITLTLFEFETKHREALLELQDIEGFDGRPGEEIFIVYSFVFSMSMLSKELRELIRVVRWLGRPVGGIWDLLSKSEQNIFVDHRESSLLTEHLTSTTMRRRPSHFEHEHALSGQHEKVPMHTFWLRFRHRLWSLTEVARSHDVRFAIKTALVMISAALPAYLDVSRDLWLDLRANWAVFSIFVIASPTVGGTNILGLYRLLGTVFGSIYGYLAWTLFPGSIAGIAAMLLVLACPLFYINLYTPYNRLASVCLLASVVISMAKYLNRGTPEYDSIFELAWKRGAMVATGVLLGMISSWYLWPFVARAELRAVISKSLIHLANLYGTLVSSFLVRRYHQDGNEQPQQRHRHHHHHIDFEHFDLDYRQAHKIHFNREFATLSLAAQLQISRATEMLALTRNEPRLKGPFPERQYKDVIDHCQRILDRLNSIHDFVNIDFSSIEESFIIPLNKYRKELVGMVLLYMHILSSAFQLKQPVAVYFPPAREARNRLIFHVRRLPAVRNRHLDVTNPAFVAYYTYTLVMENIISDLEHLEIIVKELFGTWSHVQDAFLDENEVHQLRKRGVLIYR